MIEICALASGSNGNCYYVGNEKEAVLVDAGITARQLKLRMHARGLDIEKVKAIFISHEHIDHVRGARVIHKQMNIPIFFTKNTYEKTHEKSRPVTYHYFDPEIPVCIGEFTVHPFIKDHDATEPCSFRVETVVGSVGVFTDIGIPNDALKSHLSACRAVFMESNYDHEMLMNGPYPYYLKQRVASNHGHLSNEQSVEFIDEFGGEQLESVFLSHLSAENNTPEKAMEEFKTLHGRLDVYMTSRHEPSAKLILK